jgi:hypothetical protein|nr:MAG TPA: hypothetical protein [Caudoviricetes sp.]
MTDTLFFIDEDEVLAHHGVKGMKWGVRKQRAASGGAGSTKKRKGLSRKQKAAIAGVLGTAAAAGAGYYLHKSGKGKKIAALAKKAGASAKSTAQGKGRNLGAQARVKKAQAKRFAKSAAEKLKTTKAGKYAEGARLGANAAAFKARKAAEGGASGVKSAAGMAARSAKSKLGKKTPGKALSTHVVQPGKGVGYRKLATTGTKVMGGKGDAAKKLAKVAAAGVGVQAGVNVAGAAGARAINKKLNGGKKSGSSRKRRR